jgi:TonB family protein
LNREKTQAPNENRTRANDNTWLAGTVIRDKYRLLSWIGAGGMAAVYRAEHVHFNEVRALKVINRELAGNSSFVRRFMQEAVLTRRLRHPNAVRVDDIDRAEDGRPFIVMEYVEGRALQDIMREQGPMAPARVCAIVKQLAAALEAAHSLGIVHRDVKPSNIILRSNSQGERAVVLDFGIAKAREAQLGESGPEHATMTGAGLLIGTPAYMSPEQATGKRGDELDGRSDLYSLGVVMYQMLTGELPLKADSELQLLLAHVSETPVPLRVRRPETPHLIADLVMKCLEKDREQRPKDAHAVINEIKFWERQATRQVSMSSLTSGTSSPRQSSPVSPGAGHSRESLYKTIFGDAAAQKELASREAPSGDRVTRQRPAASRRGHYLILLVLVSLSALTGVLFFQRHGLRFVHSRTAVAPSPTMPAEAATITSAPKPVDHPVNEPPEEQVNTEQASPTQQTSPTPPTSLSEEAAHPLLTRSEAHLLKVVQPAYPPLAREARVQGNVEFVATISRNGDVRELRLVSGHPLLVKAAEDALVQWKYTPALENGKPHETNTNVVVRFVLKPKQAS